MKHMQHAYHGHNNTHKSAGITASGEATTSATRTTGAALEEEEEAAAESAT